MEDDGTIMLLEGTALFDDTSGGTNPADDCTEEMGIEAEDESVEEEMISADPELLLSLEVVDDDD